MKSWSVKMIKIFQLYFYLSSTTAYFESWPFILLQVNYETWKKVGAFNMYLKNRYEIEKVKNYTFSTGPDHHFVSVLDKNWAEAHGWRVMNSFLPDF